MKSDKYINCLLDEKISYCIRLGKIYQKLDQEETLNGLYSWWQIVTLCDILDKNMCEVWNQIVKECPNLGDITEC